MSDDSNPPTLCFIGAGNMASALIGGLIHNGHPAERIIASDPDAGKLQRLRQQHGLETREDNREAAREAVLSHLRGMCERIRVPKVATYQVADIMANQLRFQQTRGRKPQQFRNHRDFPDAFLYFKFASKTHPRNLDLLKFWEEQRKVPLRD